MLRDGNKFIIMSKVVRIWVIFLLYLQPLT
jgi:hypothetical protein